MELREDVWIGMYMTRTGKSKGENAPIRDRISFRADLSSLVQVRPRSKEEKEKSTKR